jgi:NADPH2:quinone reductase
LLNISVKPAIIGFMAIESNKALISRLYAYGVHYVFQPFSSRWLKADWICSVNCLLILFVVPEEVVKEVTRSDQAQALQTTISSGLLRVVQLTVPAELKVMHISSKSWAPEPAACLRGPWRTKVSILSTRAKNSGWQGQTYLANWRAMSSRLMKALRFAEFGPPSVLRIEEVAIPEPGEGEALVHVKAAGINPSDIGNVSGHFKATTLPRTPGRDFAGTVVKGKHHQGEEVWGIAPKLGIVHDGSHAEYVVVPAETVSPKPKSLSMAQAAAIGIPYITAWASVVGAAQIQPGETILIVGAAGAVGQAATQIANGKQARVIGAAVTSDPIPGTVSVVDTRTEDLREKVFELTAGKGVDVVLDTVGGPMFEPALRSLGFRGRHVAVSSREPRVSFSLVDFYHNFSQLLGVDSYGLASRQVGEIAAELGPGFETGVLKPPRIELSRKPWTRSSR